MASRPSAAPSGDSSRSTGHPPQQRTVSPFPLLNDIASLNSAPSKRSTTPLQQQSSASPNYLSYQTTSAASSPTPSHQSTSSGHSSQGGGLTSYGSTGQQQQQLRPSALNTTLKPTSQHALNTGKTPLPPSILNGSTVLVHPNGQQAINTSNHPIPHSAISDSEWEEAVVLRDGRRYPIAEREKHVGLLALFAIIYFCVASGPYGVEEAMRGAGPGWTLLFVVLLPIIQHLPIGLLTCELASAMPQNGGYIIWISRAFGNFWSFQEGWWCWSSALVDCCLYVFILVAYLQAAIGTVWHTVGEIDNDWVLYAARVCSILIITVTNLLGIQVVGVMSVLFAVITLAPFFAMAVFGVGDIVTVVSDTSARKQFFDLWSVTDVHWGLMLSALLWVGSGWDSPGTVAGDVKSPRRTYPRAVYLAVIAVIITNIAPLTAAIAAYVGNDLSFKTWDITTNFWADMAYRIGGSQLWICVEFAAIITSVGLMSLLITSSAWALYALSLPGLLDMPSLTKLHPYFRTPVRCISVNTLLLCACALASFSALLQIAMSLHMASLSLEAASLVWLRIVEPTMKRPYKIPFGSVGLVLMFVPQAIINVVLFLYIDRIPFFIVTATIAGGFVAYFLARLVDRLSLPAGTEPESVDLEELFETIAESGNTTMDGEEGRPYDMHGEGEHADVPELGSRTLLFVESTGLMTESDGEALHHRYDDIQESDESDESHTASPVILSQSPTHRHKQSSQHMSSRDHARQVSAQQEFDDELSQYERQQQQRKHQSQQSQA